MYPYYNTFNISPACGEFSIDLLSVIGMDFNKLTMHIFKLLFINTYNTDFVTQLMFIKLLVLALKFSIPCEKQNMYSVVLSLKFFKDIG